MSYFESFILGLVQGLGEFLPISSSAHLVIAPWFFEFTDPGLAFDVALHFGTLLAVVFYFWKDWSHIAKGTWNYFFKKRGEDRFSFLLLVYLIVATIPGALAGYFLNDLAEHELRHPLLVAFNMIFLGALLFWADRRVDHTQKNLQHMTFAFAVVIGVLQALALFPGVSRSGITIMTALLLGFNRVDSARFSFLLATPITFGACLLKAPYFLAALQNPQALIGIVTATLFGFLSIKYLLKLVANFSYKIFCYYRFVFGVVVIILYCLRTL